jgi:ABC-type phosphate/phosphonate transport system substrate-binding protein
MSELVRQCAALPMYTAHRPAVLALWEALASHLRLAGVPDVPQALEWPEHMLAHWLAPGLLLSQACGFPLVTVLGDRVQVLGAFHYNAPGCDAALNRSQIVVRASDPAQTLEDLRGRRLAINGTDSQSGYNSLRALLAPLARNCRFFAATLTTGAHLRSVLAVRDAQADVASIDCVSLAGLRRHLPDTTRGLRVLAQSAPYPGLPLVTAAATPPQTVQALRTALDWVCTAPALQGMREDLFIRAFEPVPRADYQVCLAMQAQADAAGVVIA